VPPVLEARADLLVTAALPGRSAVDPRWTASPQQAAAAVGQGLRALHDALPVDGCPFSWSAADRLADLRFDPAAWHPDHAHLGVEEARDGVAVPPPVDRLVVCHGDACVPNTLIADDGSPAGHVDLGALGVADRWADLAVATWSTVWNYGPGYEEVLLAAYGVDPDPARTAYYRLLWELGP
jgi:kanamycin kinase